MKRKHLLLTTLTAFSLAAFSAPVPVKVTMNATSATMSLKDASGNPVETGEPTSLAYNFQAEPGKYILTAYDKSDSKIVNGTIEITVTDGKGSVFGDDLDDRYKDGIDDVNQFTIITNTVYLTNKHEDDTSTNWNLEDGDYTLDIKVNTREGQELKVTRGDSKTKNRYTFLALNGNSYYVAFTPSEKHQQEGYMTLYKGGTLTANINISGAISQGGDFSITVPSGADLELGMKFTHFTDYTIIDPVKVEEADGGMTFSYRLANGQIYNYRTWKPGGLTHGGYFTMSTDAANCPDIRFKDEDYTAHAPEDINHTVKSNGGYETGDILLNINPRGHLKLKPNQKFLVHAMRMWEITDNSTNNYFIEPDFHYTVLDTDFKPSSNVIEIENCSEKGTSAWSTISAKGQGTAIVLVTYDGINLNFYNKAEKKEYMGGEYWGGIWPENTGVFVVTVGEGDSQADPHMTVNEKYNQDALRLAGKYVDAEHDVFYYLDTETGFPFTFTPSGVKEIEMASPEISDTKATYTGFSAKDVTLNEDGSYTLMLRYGRNIIRFTDENGKSVYQVLSAKPCHREISNTTREGSKIFQPGDKVKIQYSGLFHPANKIAGIYNMSAYVTYNGVPNGSSLILGSGQYTFGSVPSAQAVTVEIPDTLDVAANPVLIMDEGVIQVNGYGDPIGNHRNTSPLAGRSPNFTAVPHKTYFGAIPDIAINLTPYRTFQIKLEGAPENGEVELTFDGNPLKPEEDGLYSGTYGTYSLTAKADGYRCFRKAYEISDEADGMITFAIAMEELDGAWDGTSKSQPEADEEGTYQIKTPAELAWLAEHVNAKEKDQNAVLLNDLHLGNFDWTPIGSASASAFSGSFDGQGHTIAGLYINAPKANYQGLFGYVKDGAIEGLTVDGSVSGKQYVGGIAGFVTGTSALYGCANHADVTGASTYTGGVTGSISSATATGANLFNTGSITGTTNCGGVIGYNHKDTEISNIFNVGTVKGTGVGACIGGSTTKEKVSNAFSTVEYQVTAGQTLVSDDQMRSGEIAFKLGNAFFQTIGEDPYPGFTGLTVYHDEDTDEYYNLAASFEINPGEGNGDVAVGEDGILMHQDDSYRLSLTPTPAAARLPEITWESSDTAIATVDADGIVSAIANGETIITARGTVDGEDVSATCRVTVTDPKNTSGADEITDIATWFKEGAVVDVYNASGMLLIHDAEVSKLAGRLAPGLYILLSDGVAHKIMIK